MSIIDPQAIDGKHKNSSHDAPSSSKNRTYRKDKPWDNETIDHWKIEQFTEKDSSGPFLEESSFATLFPEYREKYLREVWKVVTNALAKHGIDCTLNVIEGSMTVRTTRKTWDPYAIMKARDLIKLLARSVPVSQALKIMTDETQCDIVKIGGFTRNKDRFVKRRQRLIGPNGSTLKAIELLTDCYILVQGNTVACMGSFKGLKQARRIIEDCMKNVHPVYNIKALMIKRELSKDEALKEENWDRFLPKFKKRNPKKTKKAQRDSQEKQYNPFPPLPQPSRIDLQLESGEYFMSEHARKQHRVSTMRAEREKKSQQKQEAREQHDTPPDETASKKRSRVDDETEDVQALASKVKRQLKKRKAAK